jgi:hypothetical protein
MTMAETWWPTLSWSSRSQLVALTQLGLLDVARTLA